MKNVVVTGTLSFDFIMDFPGHFYDRIMPDKLHSLSLSFLVDKLSKQHGGTAGNIAYSMRLLGMNPVILAPAGNDFGSYKEFLIKNNINTDYISIHKNVATSVYSVMTDQNHCQIGSFFIGPMKYATRLHITDVPNRENLVILAPNEPAAMKQYVSECKTNAIPYMYDPAFQIGNFTPEELREGIESAKILIGNDYEIALIEQKLGVSHEELILMMPILVTTLGAKGSIIETRHDAMHIKRCDADNMSDPTGAGDAYRAGFITGYLRALNSRPGLELTGDELVVCGQMGSVTAAYTVEKYGTQTHTFTKKELIARYKKAYGTILSL
jgi:adenosine kinase